MFTWTSGAPKLVPDLTDVEAIHTHKSLVVVQLSDNALILNKDNSPIVVKSVEQVWQSKNRLVFKIKRQARVIVYPTEADNVGRVNAYSINDKNLIGDMAVAVADNMLLFNSVDKTMTTWDLKSMCLVNKSMYLISTMPKYMGQEG